MSKLKNWCWQEALSIKYSREKLFDDMLNDSSLLIDLAKEDVAKILQKTNNKFIVQKMSFDDIYPHAIDVTKKQLQKSLSKKKTIFSCSGIWTETNLKLIRKIVQRIANNTCNLFDDRYRTCIKKDLVFFASVNQQNSIDENDGLAILIQEEEKAEIEKLLSKKEKEFISKNLSYDMSSRQTFIFRDEVTQGTVNIKEISRVKLIVIVTKTKA